MFSKEKNKSSRDSWRSSFSFPVRIQLPVSWLVINGLDPEGNERERYRNSFVLYFWWEDLESL